MIPNLSLIQNVEGINESTRIEEDLGLHGYHVRRFIFRYSEVFGVDIAYFSFNKYFSKEIPFYDFYKRLPVKWRKKEVLTLGHLMAAVKYGKLCDSVIEEIIAKKEVPDVPHVPILLKNKTYYRIEDILIFVLLGIAIAVVLAIVALIV